MENTNKLDYFYGREGEFFRFLQIPWLLFENTYYENLSLEAKVLYSLLLDRVKLSVKHKWRDRQNRVYIYFKREEAQRFLGCGATKVRKIFYELKAIGLIEEIQQGLTKPNIIYVKNFVTNNSGNTDPTKPLPDKECLNPTDENIVTVDFKHSEQIKNSIPNNPETTPINTNINNTNNNKTETVSLSVCQSYPNKTDRQTDTKFNNNSNSSENVNIQNENYWIEYFRQHINYDNLILSCPEQISLIDMLVNYMVEVETKSSLKINGQIKSTKGFQNMVENITELAIGEFIDGLSGKSILGVKNQYAYWRTAFLNHLAEREIAVATVPNMYPHISSENIMAESEKEKQKIKEFFDNFRKSENINTETDEENKNQKLKEIINDMRKSIKDKDKDIIVSEENNYNFNEPRKENTHYFDEIDKIDKIDEIDEESEYYFDEQNTQDYYCNIEEDDEYNFDEPDSEHYIA